MLIEKKKNLNRTMLGLSQECLSCHTGEHRAQLGADCLKCHAMNGWKPANKFDHARANYRLTGKHRQVECLKCHPQVTDHKFADDPSFSNYKSIKFAACTDCHRDEHNNQFGQKCESCHSTTG